MFQRLTPVIKNLIIINVVVFVIINIMISTGTPQYRYFLLYNASDNMFQPFQFVTTMFSHMSIGHLFFNMLGLFFFGPVLEQRIGEKKMIIAYILGGLFSSVAFFVYNSYLAQNNFSLLGASGAVYTVLVLTAMYYPKMKVQLIFPPIPLTMGLMVALYIGYDVYSMLARQGTGIAHLAHLGGAAMGFILYLFWEKLKK